MFALLEQYAELRERSFLVEKKRALEVELANCAESVRHPFFVERVC